SRGGQHAEVDLDSAAKWISNRPPPKVSLAQPLKGSRAGPSRARTFTEPRGGNLTTGFESEQRQTERRRHLRSDRVAASAIVLAESGFAGAFGVENLSAGGALLIGEPRIKCGEDVRILLQLEGRRPIHLSARVVGHRMPEKGPHLFAVTFLDVKPAVEDGIQTAVLTALERRPVTDDLSTPVILARAGPGEEGGRERRRRRRKAQPTLDFDAE
ncbi:MAG: PilZ domain-containing protein, partial [Myxococcaceae bacterium]